MRRDLDRQVRAQTREFYGRWIIFSFEIFFLQTKYCQVGAGTDCYSVGDGSLANETSQEFL